MKKILIILSFITCVTRAQVINTVWNQAILRADGKTEINGVEAYSMKTICGNDEFVLIKFINKNNYKVSVEWKDAIKIFGDWVYSKDQTPKTLNIDANANIEGQCNGIVTLKVKIKSIIDNPIDFGYYTVSGLTTTKLK